MTQGYLPHLPHELAGDGDCSVVCSSVSGGQTAFCSLVLHFSTRLGESGVSTRVAKTFPAAAAVSCEDLRAARRRSIATWHALSAQPGTVGELRRAQRARPPPAPHSTRHGGGLQDRNRVRVAGPSRRSQFFSRPTDARPQERARALSCTRSLPPRAPPHPPAWHPPPRGSAGISARCRKSRPENRPARARPEIKGRSPEAQRGVPGWGVGASESPPALSADYGHWSRSAHSAGY